MNSVDATLPVLAFGVLLVMLLTACGTDVVLGGRVDGGALSDARTPDGSSMDLDGNRPDAESLRPFPSGGYDLSIAPAVTLSMCAGALTGMEGAFASITRDALGLAQGPVEVVAIDATHLDVRGAPIEIGFLEPSVRLEQAGGPGVPPDVWIGGATRAEGGPLGTLLIAVELEAHQSTIAPSGFDGVAAALYIDPSVEDAQCVIGFSARFDAR